MTRRIIYAALLGLLAGFSSCSETPLDPEPVEPEYDIKLDCTRFYRYAEGGKVDVYVTGTTEDSEYEVLIPSNVDWITSTTKKGLGDSYVSFTVKPNDTSFERSANISFKYGTEKVKVLNIGQDKQNVTDYYSEWGISGTVKTSVSNSRTYNWYVDQGDTGQYSKDNCGPSTVTMVTKWYNKDYHGTAFDARALYKPNGGWWYIDTDILPFLKSKDVPYKTVNFIEDGTLKSYLDKGLIAIICLDMNVLSYDADPNHRVDRFYPTSAGAGHFMIIMGYLETDTQLYYQCYDPYSLAKIYSDKTLKGQGRYYRASELQRSVSSWEPRVFVIGK